MRAWEAQCGPWTLASQLVSVHAPDNVADQVQSLAETTQLLRQPCLPYLPCMLYLSTSRPSSENSTTVPQSFGRDILRGGQSVMDPANVDPAKPDARDTPSRPPAKCRKSWRAVKELHLQLGRSLTLHLEKLQVRVWTCPVNYSYSGPSRAMTSVYIAPFVTLLYISSCTISSFLVRTYNRRG